MTPHWAERLPGETPKMTLKVIFKCQLSCKGADTQRGLNTCLLVAEDPPKTHMIKLTRREDPLEMKRDRGQGAQPRSECMIRKGFTEER